jgi:ketosteroid isomerase-like protein
MTLTPEDRTAITDLINLHGHLVDGGDLDRLDELFTPDVVYDVTGMGAPAPLHGTGALREAALALGENNPVGHHVTNIVLTELGPGSVRGLSKGIGVMADGTCGSVTYDDVITRGPRGWRISHRKVLARRRPLGAA